MKFTKETARKYGRKGGIISGMRRTSKAKQSQVEKQMERERQIYSEFVNAEEGYFNGFEMVNVFHTHISKADALLIGESDDCAKCHGVSVGADGVTCYFFCKPEEVKKQVRFNRSVYLF